MFKTRQEVDKHVNNSLKKVNNENERNLRCFSFAKLYYNVGDYEQTIRYVTSYLSIKPKSPEGHNLLGKALERLGKKQAALEAYKASLQQDPRQNNLVLKVCELMAQDDVDVEKSGAQYFHDLAQSFDPRNPIVSNLKEKLISNGSKDPNEISQFLLKELENRPTDVNLRVKLLKHFLENNMIKEAYKHAYDIEQKKLGIFDSSIAWYEIFAEVLVRYQRDASISTQLTWEFWFLSTSVLEKLAALSLSDHLENMKTTEYITAVFNFDQSLLKVSQNVASCPDKSLLKEFLNHFEAQLCLHLSVLAFKQAKQDLMTFKEVENLVLPLLFIAYNIPVPDTQAIWFNVLPENRRLLVTGWYKEAAFRCSQAGNILLGLAKDRRNILLEKAHQYSTGIWRENVYKKIFVKRDQQTKANTSFFVASSLEPTIKLPDLIDLIKYNEIAQTVTPSSLHHYIWLALNYQNLSEFSLKSFDGLQYTVKNLANCAAETLNILDVQSFIYCATLCAQSRIKNADSTITYFQKDRPPVLPISITGNLGTLNQAKFLQAAYKMYKHEYTSDIGAIRLVLIRGIEVIRCAGNHGLDVKLLVTLASTFAEKVKHLTTQTEIDGSSARAELYWKTALPLLDKLKNQHPLVYPNNRMFEYKSNKELSQDEIAMYIEKAKIFIGIQFMKKKEYERAMDIFEGLKDPYASFYQSQIYRHMADAKTNHHKENVTSEMRSQNIILLSRARDCLYLTLDRLREPSQDKDHPLNAQLGTEIEKTERLLSRIDPDCTNRNECDGMSDENVSDDSVGEHYLSTYTHHTSFPNGRDLSAKNDTLQMHSTPIRFPVHRQEARPSPERLDAQLRQLVASKDLVINNVMEQNRRMMTELQQCLTDEIRDALKNMTVTVSEKTQASTGSIGDVKKMIDELTNSVDDRLQSITDVVQEMRKELNDIKKEQSKNAQLSVEDLYELDPDYNSSIDYNLASNMGGAPPSNLNSMANNMYPNYQRLPQAPAPNLAAYGGQGLYPGLYPGFSYPYGLGLPQAGLPFLPPPPADQQMPPLGSMPGMMPPLYPPMNPPLAHIASQSQSIPNQARDSPKPAYSAASLGQTGFGVSQSSVIQPPQGLLQVNESPKLPLFPSAAPGSFGQSGFLGQSLSIASPASTNVPSSKAPPVNVVITSSDPLPTFKTTTAQPILSVTIPPQHIKGNVQKPVAQTVSSASQAHNYYIPLPSTSATATTPSILSQPAPLITTQSLLTNVPSPIYSAISKTPSKNVSLGIEIEKALDKTFATPDKTNTTLNKSNISTTSNDEYDPRPDFQPIIPLPDEVPVNTGEEKETELFCQRAKLFRLALVNNAKEWKERGIGNIKILYNPETGKVRLLMRREQVHKICANHFLTEDMALTPMSNNDRVYIWAAHDYADGELVVEKFCAKFKTAEEAKKFAEAFSSAKTKITEKPSGTVETAETKKSSAPSTPKVEVSSATAACNLGGFKFVSAPTFKPTDSPKPAPKVEEVKDKPAPASPFAAFSFGSKQTGTPVKNLFENLEPAKFSPLVVSQNNSKVETPKQGEDEVEEFVPTAKFKPVVEKLPDLVEIKTGEENAKVLFEERCKLFRLDKSGEKTEWKERGVGNIKILKDDLLRLVMRRDQVHKVCLNHQVPKDMSFKKNPTDPKAIIWHAQDFSEGILKPETLTARFKNEELANTFLKTLQNSQISMDENDEVTGNKHHKAEEAPKIGFGEKFKAAKGSWECKNCYILNEGKANHCVACDSLKAGSSPKKEEPTFSFSVKPTSDTSKTEVTITPIGGGWGNQFKKAVGSWDCQTCYVTNAGDITKCISCETPKEGTAADKTSSSGGLKGISLDTGGQTFTFGIPPSTAKPENTTTVTQKPEQPLQKFSFSVPPPATKIDSTSVVSGFGDSYKPKPGTWECKSCYIRNEAGSLYCLSCDSPKDDSVPKKEPTGPKGINLETPGMKFNFGMPATTSASNVTSSFAFGDSSANKVSFSWKPLETVNKDDDKTDDQFVFGSPQKHDFDFKPRSPRKISTGQGEESDASYVEEEDVTVYFKPVVPLPDIVVVKTGEENEKVLYSHRAKLFRFTNGEWKERGLGDVKILKDSINGKLRVVMRREQVLKICLNHWLTTDIEYLSKDEKTWLFHAADFSESELIRDQFCLRFKSAEIAQEFKKAVDDALAGKDTEQKIVDVKTTKEESDSDVEFVSETQVTAEEEKEAVRLGLPPKFLAYRQRPDCSCEQCKKDDEYLKELFNKEPVKPIPKSSSLNTTLFGTPVGSLGTPSSGSVFGSPATSFTFGTPKDVTPTIRQPKAETLRALLTKTPVSQESTMKAENATTPTSASLVMAANTPKATDNITPKTVPTFPGFVFGGSIQKTNNFGASPSSIFGGTPIDEKIADKPKEGASIFGGPPKAESTIFGTPKEGTNIFANPPKEASIVSGPPKEEASIFSTPKESTNIFAGPPKEGASLFELPKEGANISGQPKEGASIFSSTKETSNNIFASSKDNIFAIKPSNSEANSKSLFTPKSNLFSAPTGTPNLFQSSPSSTNIFGSSSGTSLFGATTNTGLFGTSSQGSIFSNSTTPSKNLFGQTIFGNKSEPKITDATLSFGSTESAASNAPVFKTDDSFSFANLAAKVNSQTESTFTAKSDNKNPFAHLGAGTPVFGGAGVTKKAGKATSNKDQLNKTEEQEGSDNEEEEGGSEHDPHFEPIVPLPDQIVVSTGEEDEDVLFNERAKLFRFDSNTKEWKERGIGQLKILYHPKNKTYRILLRREQVHKVVLNQRLTPDLELQPMSTSDKAWIWAGMNYTDEEANLEQLAVRFKFSELAVAFKKCIEENIKKLVETLANKSQSSDSQPITVRDFGLENISNDEVQEYNEYDEDEDDEEDDEDDRAIMFSKRCTLSLQTEAGWEQICMGELQVFYDPELFVARINVIADNGQIVCNTIIGKNTMMAIDGKECWWKGVDWTDIDSPQWQTFKATFSSTAAAEEFHSNFLEGISYAQEVDLDDGLQTIDGGAESDNLD
ncbi:unnamed protein product [Ceutorhynchus assimilis]|uniref:Nuclear pore complex protein Nup153 n=1 Tax=Ceutorhynchus assimilis TaxID=467358 RepID=A0A9P0DLX1_9CUCU|nr:unnamed protein product [Ceutorhynchus assimilis]